MTPEQMEKEIKRLKAELEKVKKDLKTSQKNMQKERTAAGKSSALLGSPEDIGTLTNLYEALNEQFSISEKTLKNLSQSGAFFVKGGPLMDGLTSSIKEMDALFGNARMGAESFQYLAKQFKNFQQLAEAQRDSAANLAGELSKQAAVLNELGLSYGAFTENIDFAIYSMGAGAKEVQNLNTSIVELSNQVGMLPEQMSRNFQTVSKSLAYNFNEIKNQFVKIQQLSNETGVSIDNLMGKFGRPMDTISGASQMAAKLNSLLGRNRFSATELLMMTEEDRMTSIRGALMEQGLDQQALAGGVQGKFALQSVQEVLGMGLDDTRRFLQTGGLKKDIAGQVGEAFEGGPMGQGGASDQFVKSSVESADALDKFRDRILGLLDPLEEVAVRTREQALRGRGTAPEELTMAAGLFSQLGALGTLQVQKAAGQDFQFRKLLQTTSQDEIQAAGIDLDETAGEILKGGADARTARADVRRKLSEFREERGSLSVVDTAIIGYLKRQKNLSKFGIPNKVANFLRGGAGKNLTEGFTVRDIENDETLAKLANQAMKGAGVDAGTMEQIEGALAIGNRTPQNNPNNPGSANTASSAGAAMTTQQVFHIYVGNTKLDTVFNNVLEDKGIGGEPAN